MVVVVRSCCNYVVNTAHSILTLLRAEIKSTGACAIMVTHSQAAAEMADKVLILTKSGIQETTAVNPMAQETR